MKPILLLVLALSLGACSSGGRGDGTTNPPPATVKMDSSGVVVDTSASR
jgi:hypothetical protein